MSGWKKRLIVVGDRVLVSPEEGEEREAGELFRKKEYQAAPEKVMQVLENDPDNQAALSGIQSIRDRFARWGRVAEGREDWESAKAYYRTALQVGPPTAGLQEALARAEKNSQ